MMLRDRPNPLPHSYRRAATLLEVMIATALSSTVALAAFSLVSAVAYDQQALIGPDLHSEASLIHRAVQDWLDRTESVLGLYAVPQTDPPGAVDYQVVTILAYMGEAPGRARDYPVINYDEVEALVWRRYFGSASAPYSSLQRFYFSGPNATVYREAGWFWVGCDPIDHPGMLDTWEALAQREVISTSVYRIQPQALPFANVWTCIRGVADILDLRFDLLDYSQVQTDGEWILPSRYSFNVTASIGAD